MMGGSAKIIAKGKQLIAQGKYLHATEILDKLVFADAWCNQEALSPARRCLRAVGLSGREHQRAQYLPAGLLRAAQRPARRIGTAYHGTGRGARHVNQQWLDFVGISMDPKKAEGMRFTINL